MTRHIGYYVLDDDGRPLALDDGDTLLWALWFKSHDRRVALDRVGDVRVSTVFLGLNHDVVGAILGVGEPLLWETLIFGGPHDGEMWRYASRDAAEAGHAATVAAEREAAAQSTGVLNSSAKEHLCPAPHFRPRAR